LLESCGKSSKLSNPRKKRRSTPAGLKVARGGCHFVATSVDSTNNGSMLGKSKGGVGVENTGATRTKPCRQEEKTSRRKGREKHTNNKGLHNGDVRFVRSKRPAESDDDSNGCDMDSARQQL
jgi:hypothetical protein